MAALDNAFEQLVFSGGGTRCFWHGGFLDVVEEPLRLRPKRISGVSGGALSGSCFIARREQKLLDVMGEAFVDLQFNHSTCLNDIQTDGLTPHQRIYREVVEEVLDADAVHAIATGPSFQVLIAHPPSEAAGKLSTFPMMAAYLADLAIRSTPHVTIPAKLGGERTMVDARRAAADGMLHDLICSAAVIPPVFNLAEWEDRPVIDGGMTSKAPMPVPDEGRTLILLTRKFRNLPHEKDRVYVEPSAEVPADKIDFTDRQQIHDTWQAGRRDGQAFLKVQETAMLDAVQNRGRTA